jgi:hypothetical protein
MSAIVIAVGWTLLASLQLILLSALGKVSARSDHESQMHFARGEVATLQLAWRLAARDRARRSFSEDIHSGDILSAGGEVR